MATWAIEINMSQSNLVAKSAGVFDPTCIMTRVDVTKTGMSWMWLSNGRRPFKERQTRPTSHFRPSRGDCYAQSPQTWQWYRLCLPTTRINPSLYIKTVIHSRWGYGSQPQPRTHIPQKPNQRGATAVYNSASAKVEDIKLHGTWTFSAWRIHVQREKSYVVSALKKLSL